MNLSMLLIGLPVFLLVYQGVGWWFESRESSRSPWGAHRPTNSGSRLRDWSGFGSKLGFNKILLRNARFRERLELMLLRSGHPFGWKADDLVFIKEVGVCLAAFFLWRLDVSQPLLWLVGLFLGFWLPDVYIQAKGASRRAEIQRQLPGFIDLIALTLESGLDLLAATERILEKMKPSALREELQMLIQETRLGTPRKEALQHWAYRAPLPDIVSLTSMITQSEELGTSLATVLRTYAEDMRNRRILRAEEVAGKAPVKLLLPMMVFFFPIVFVVIFGPLALNFFSSYK
jgi:tight adherence protein C